MFEKIKQKVCDTKNWIVEHKKEIVIGVLGVSAGVAGAMIYDNKNNNHCTDEQKRCLEYMDDWDKESDVVVATFGAKHQQSVNEISDRVVQDTCVAGTDKVVGGILYLKTK